MQTRLITQDDIVERYLADAEWQRYVQVRKRGRDTTLPELRAITQRFTRAEASLRTFRDQLDAIIREQEHWGLQGRGFMGTLSLFVKYHDDKEPVVEPFLRDLLSGLNAENMGERLEQLYDFLQIERTRLRHEGKSSHTAAAPGNSALIVSAFTAWLDPEHCPVIYYEGVRRGICLLYKASLLPEIHNVVVNRDTIEVRYAHEHKAFLQALNAIDLRVKTTRYWPEFFLYWVLEHFQSLTEPANVLRKEDETSTLAVQVNAAGGATVQESAPEYALAGVEAAALKDGVTLIPPGPLRATPEPLLSELIREVQQRILVDEQTIRRIYQALLAGHVILAGPPGTGKTELARLVPEILWRSRSRGAAAEGEAQEDDEAWIGRRARPIPRAW